ncbi:glycosyltransferase [Xylanimonas allomyrinae]|uniref:Glycosyltransferase n=1 Tax=Xylanimonas allomyrinae TaxID=2509459 RepID=A0A4P6ESJ6_9MICO|nr:glycosyltransferase [Xylanimonas allomyrinae]QAY63377.1 glycosyltransferase [Xylanimonas allomyrinae]
MRVAVTATADTAAHARVTVQSLQAVAPHLTCHVLDVDDTYLRVADEEIAQVGDLAVAARTIALTHDDDAHAPGLTVAWAAALLEHADEAVVGIAPGIVLLCSPERLVTDEATTVAVTRRARAGAGVMAQPSVLSTDLFVLGTAARAHLDELRSLAEGWASAARSLDTIVAYVPHRLVVDDAVIVSRWNCDHRTRLVPGTRTTLAREGRDVVALDLAEHDPSVPWLFNTARAGSTGPWLSRNPELAAIVAAADLPGPDIAPGRQDAQLVRSIARTAQVRGDDLDDVYGRLDEWLLELVPAGDRTPVARYLEGIYATRPDLRAAFPSVPGRDSAHLAQWARDHGVREAAYDPHLLARAAELTASAQPEPEPEGTIRPHGVNLVGYLAGEVGVGTSARLMDAALAAAGVPTSTFAVTKDLQSRATARFRHTEPVRFDTTLIAVNADQTPAVSAAVDDVVAGTHRIGMWYWEVEAFPADRDHAFAHVDEIWAATDFVRDAIGARSPVPVRTVPPPLPQRTDGDAPEVPARLGIPTDRPWFFFAFDYLSTAERKNPWGLVAAFSRAFAPGEGPTLVVKTLNAGRRPAEAERLRLLAAQRPDVIVIDEYLHQDELTALSARCTAYVSLHRAEGLGLTIAESMAWGRPVVVSAYSGNMQFTTAANAYLVPCSPGVIPRDAEPYPAGTPWGDPDLDVGAAHMRRIVEFPDEAEARGRQAAEDIRTLHSPEAAGVGIYEALDMARAARAACLERREAAAEEAARAAAAAEDAARTLRGRLRRRVSSIGSR